MHVKNLKLEQSFILTRSFETSNQGHGRVYNIGKHNKIIYNVLEIILKYPRA